MAPDKIYAVRATVQLQLLSGIAGFLILALISQSAFAFAYLYGVVLMVANGIWLAARLGKVRNMDAKGGQQSLYAGAAIRFIALIAGLLLAQMLKLHLLYVAGGMFIAQMALFLSALLEIRKKGEDVG